MKRNWLYAIVIVAVTLSVGGGLPAQKARAAGTIYTWNQTDTEAWTTATNWTPIRTTPETTDILQFNGGGIVTVTGVPSQTIGQLLISNNTTANLQADATNTLTIAGDTGTDLDVSSGSALNLNGTNALTILVGTDATGSVSGSMTCTAGPHRLNASDARGITFNSGAVLTQGTGCTGNIFGASGTANTIVFAAGSIFVSQGGSNPFALTQPNSKVVFQPGSLYRHEQTSALSFSGRTYGNLELNVNSTQSGSGSAALSIDNLAVTTGTLNLGMTGVFNLKGNISVAPGATLNFNPANAMTITLNGSAPQSISGAGTLTFTANAGVAITNSTGVTLQRNVVFSGPVTVTTGAALNANGYSITAGALTNNGILTQTLSVTGTTDVNFFNTGDYGGVTINANNGSGGVDLGSTVVAIRGNQNCDTNNTAVHRCFQIAPATSSGLNATVTFYYANAELNSESCVSMDAYRWAGSSWSLAGTSGTRQCATDPYSLQVTGITNFSKFALSSGGASPTAVTLLDLTANSPASPAPVVLGVCSLCAGGLLLRRRAARSIPN
jgi:hypothetical protein